MLSIAPTQDALISPLPSRHRRFISARSPPIPSSRQSTLALAVAQIGTAADPMLALAHSSPPHLAPLPIAPTRPSTVSPPRAISAGRHPHQAVADPIADRSPSGLHQIAAAPPDHYPRQRGAKEVLGLMEGELFRSSGEDQDTIHVLDRSQIDSLFEGAITLLCILLCHRDR
uniref:Uncharacterized protein n=1 Tax=Oryza nivara TaxID=4536 RepID=A0A0E0J6A8_ORYNI